MDLNKLRDEAYTDACKHGWHKEEHSDEHWLMLVLTEIAEAVQADRNDRHASVSRFNEEAGESFFIAYRECVSSTVEDELADIVIRCLDLAGLRNIKLSTPMPMKGNVRLDMTFPEYAFNTCHVLAMSRLPLDVRLENVIDRILFYCEAKGIDIEWFIEQKMKYNRLRPYRHGGLKY